MNTNIPTARPTVVYLSKETKHLEEEVVRLREEAARPRIKTSQAIAELRKFTEEHKDEDHLTKGIPTTQNPFLEKHGNCCSIM